MKPSHNLGHHERMIRIAVGLTLLALSGFSTLPGWGDLLIMMIGLIALLTGILGYCPAWHMIGTNTCTVDHKASHATSKEELHEHRTHTTHRP